MEFTEEEVRMKLQQLGYLDVPRSKLLEFMADLEELIELDLSNCTSSINEGGDESKVVDSTQQQHPLKGTTAKTQRKAFAKEKVRSMSASHHISFDKENATLFDRNDIPVFDSTRESLSSTLLDTEDPDETLKKVNPMRPDSAMKRKVVRKRDGSSRIFDESASTHDGSVLSDITDLEDKVRNLPVTDDDRLSVNSSRPASSMSYKKQQRSKSASSINSTSSLLSDIPGGVLPSFIRLANSHPHTKNLMKCDPVSRFHQFNKEWQRGKVPGESGHSNLRWNVRERMLHCEVFEKPRRQHTTNDYVVPTDKKRQALRWKVRTAMANM